MRHFPAAARSLPALLPLVAAALAAPAFAQTASINVIHDDPDGIVLPGDTVRITVLASFVTSPPGMLAGLSGDAVNSGAQGTASNLSSWYQQGGLVNYGSPVGGSVYGLSIAAVPPFFGPCGFILPHCGWNTDVHMLEFDWQAGDAASPTFAHFNFLASPTMPGLMVFLSPWTSPAPTLLPTTFTGTSLLVLPAPAASVTLLGGLLTFARRRR